MEPCGEVRGQQGSAGVSRGTAGASCGTRAALPPRHQPRCCIQHVPAGREALTCQGEIVLARRLGKLEQLGKTLRFLSSEKNNCFPLIVSAPAFRGRSWLSTLLPGRDAASLHGSLGAAPHGVAPAQTWGLSTSDSAHKGRNLPSLQRDALIVFPALLQPLALLHVPQLPSLAAAPNPTALHATAPLHPRLDSSQRHRSPCPAACCSAALDLTAVSLLDHGPGGEAGIVTR